MRKTLPPSLLEKMKFELGELDRHFVEIDGRIFKPSQCYRFDADAAHILYNTNCPDGLKQKVEAILSKYRVGDESDS